MKIKLTVLSLITSAFVCMPFLFVSGCKTASVAAISVTKVVDTAMKAWAEASVKGLTTVEFDTKVVDAHDKYRRACKIAADSLERVGENADKDLLLSTLKMVKAAADPLIDLISDCLAPTQSSQLKSDLQKAARL